ncbi:MAG: hypothetical protein QOH64_947 [Acidimicrobiaceae bacterium]|jgi:hypothetical protein
MDRRAAFFVLSAALCGLMIPAAEADVRWVAEVTAITYLVLALVSYLDFRSRHREQN